MGCQLTKNRNSSSNLGITDRMTVTNASCSREEDSLVFLDRISPAG